MLADHSAAAWPLLITGAIVQTTGSFLPAFVLAGVIACASAVFYMKMTKQKITG